MLAGVDMRDRILSPKRISRKSARYGGWEMLREGTNFTKRDGGR
jgi:hypothetical protein